MRLKTRLTLAFLAVAWIPLGAVVWVLTERTDSAFEASFIARKDAVVAAARERLGGVSEDVRVALERMSEDSLVATDLVEALKRGTFYKAAERGGLDYERDAVRVARRLIKSRALDTLRLVDLVDKPGHVIAIGHRVGVEPPDEEIVALARGERQAGAFFRKERVEDAAAGTAVEVWTLQRIAVVGGVVALVGGKIIDRALLEELRVGGGQEAHLALDDARGQRVAATFSGAAPPQGQWARGVQPIPNPEHPELSARLTVWVSREGVRQQNRDLWKTAGILGGLSGLIALLAGLWMSRRISRPLERLAEAASAVAGGARDRQVLELSGRDEVAQLTRAFNQMTLDLGASEERLRQSERVAAWREIARRIAHEIKNPLFPIQMSIETLKKVWERKHPDFEEIFEESTATILEEVGRMKRIVTEFSNFARMPAPRPLSVDLVELVGQVVSLVKETAPEVSWRLVAPEVLDCWVDPDQLRQALLNLVKNGVEALRGRQRRAPDGATLEVRVEQDGARAARIVVTDNGPGMDEETLGKLFVPYFTTKAEGTGLGLAIVHRIIAEHEGEIRVDSRPGVGTRFVVTLPLEPTRGGVEE